MSYSITLRKMTKKSILGFGYTDQRDLSVGQLIDLGERKVLVSSYFGLSKITFIDEILDELNILPEYRIEKPGKLNIKECRIATKKVMQLYYDSLSENKKMGIWNTAQKKKRIKANSKIGFINKTTNSKSKLKNSNRKYI